MDDVSDHSPVGTVRLLHPTRLPPRHAKLVAVRMEGKNQQETVEFLLKFPSGDCVGPSRQGGVLHPTPAELHSRPHLHGRGAGHEVDPNCPHSTTTEEDNNVSRLEVSSSNPTPDITADEVTFPHLSEEERGQLQSCLQEYAGLFANDNFNLGSIDAVIHTIDTGDHPAIRQPS